MPHEDHLQEHPPLSVTIRSCVDVLHRGLCSSNQLYQKVYPEPEIEVITHQQRPSFMIYDQPVIIMIIKYL